MYCSRCNAMVSVHQIDPITYKCRECGHTTSMSVDDWLERGKEEAAKQAKDGALVLVTPDLPCPRCGKPALAQEEAGTPEPEQ